MSYGQGEPPWDPWKPSSQQPPQWGDRSGGTPDWAALAEASEARNKRRRLLLILGGALATVGIGAAVAVAVVSANGSPGASNRPASALPGTADIPSESATAVPSFAPTSAPPPLDPMDFISSAKKDTAPINADALFPGTQLTEGANVYKKGPTASTTNCASAVQGTLPAVLTKNNCTLVVRATYTTGRIAVTVGVAVFDTAAQATKAKQQTNSKSIITSLTGKGVPTFCRTTVCRSTTNSYGRYAYFTLGGFTNGKDVTAKDAKVFTAGDDLAEFAFRQIRRRGEAQASAAANQ
ncbi:hypothetical protein ACFOZ0_34490 [Streptomyces yaanensis]|uniref:Tat pathway signal sequence domain protein n=1 Tax=Streptomyces yaanensis TaxID=1142239 RepID=A0ABV7SMS3_9ACTN|nr:hypothetical protein [Streptomyces sp. CGMCC 4.7035]WNB97240.1 hypothetical protein Q2K21_03655 [Streptomyces sp. CGMCC 4.7035]